MIIYKSKYFDDNKGNDDEISSKDRKRVIAATIGSGLAAYGVNDLSESVPKNLAKKSFLKNREEFIKNNGGRLTELSPKELEKIDDYLHKYAGEKYPAGLSVSDINPLNPSGKKKVSYAGYHYNPKKILLGDPPVRMTDKEFKKLIKEHPELLKNEIGTRALGTGVFGDFIYSPKAKGIEDLGTLAHEIGHHEIDNAKSKSVRDFLEKVAQKVGGYHEGTSDNSKLRLITRTALPFGITARNGWVVDEDDDDKIKLNKSSLIYPGVNVLGDSAVTLYETGASRRGLNILKDSKLASEGLLKSIDASHLNYNTELRKHSLLGNVITGAAATGLGLGVGRLRAELYKDKKRRETEETKNSLTGEYDRYVIPRKDNTKGLTEDEKKRLRNANLLGAGSAVATAALPLEIMKRVNIETAKKLAKEANLKDLAERASKQTHLKRTLPAALLTAGGIAGAIKANNMAKKKKEGE